MRYLISFIAVFSLTVLTGAMAFATSLTVTNTFVAGDPAIADDVNTNFTEVEAAVTDNDTRITTNDTAITSNTGAISSNTTAISGKQERVTGTCAAAEAISAIAADGTVTCETIPLKTGNVSASGIVGVPRDSTYGTVQGGGTDSNGVGYLGRSGVVGNEYLVVPISLPDGATITSFSYTAFDNDAVNNSSAFLYWSGGSSVATSVTTGGASLALQTVSTTTINEPVVDNSQYGYFFYMQVYGTTAIVAVSASVGYTLP